MMGMMMNISFDLWMKPEYLTVTSESIEIILGRTVLESM